MTRTHLILLGTGSPNILPQRSQSALVIVVDESAYMIDCGGGAVQRLSQAAERYRLPALQVNHLERLFLTHLHPDHTTGIADAIIAPWVLERKAPLQVYGPRGTASLCERLLEAYTVGIGEHRDGLAPIDNPLEVVVQEIDSPMIYADDKVIFEAFPVQHGALEAYGYKVTTPDRTIVISGDTAPTETLIEKATGCDVLVHEVYSAKQLASRPEEWQKYHTTMHTSTIELAKLANVVRPQLLVLTHQLLWGTTETALIAEVTTHYDGAVVSGHDLDLF